MPQARRRRRALRAALGLAVVLALGFAADATRSRDDACPRRCGDRSPEQSPTAGDRPRPERATIDRSPSAQRVSRPGRRSPGVAIDALPPLVESGSAGRLGSVVAGDDRRHPGSGRLRWNHRRRPPVLAQGAGVGMQVVGRVSLSPKHTVYLLRVGRRVLLVGAGPQGSPSLISELDDLAEIEPTHRQEKRHERDAMR